VQCFFIRISLEKMLRNVFLLEFHWRKCCTTFFLLGRLLEKKLCNVLLLGFIRENVCATYFLNWNRYKIIWNCFIIWNYYI